MWTVIEWVIAPYACVMLSEGLLVKWYLCRHKTSDTTLDAGPNDEAHLQ